MHRLLLSEQTPPNWMYYPRDKWLSSVPGADFGPGQLLPWRLQIFGQIELEVFDSERIFGIFIE